jgi:hypothetical protein
MHMKNPHNSNQGRPAPAGCAAGRRRVGRLGILGGGFGGEPG